MRKIYTIGETVLDILIKGINHLLPKQVVLA